jgi:hypothetical protein
MKKLTGFSFIAFLLFLSTLQTGVSSCTKDVLHDTVTVVKKDTIVTKDTLLSTKILTANAWKIKELRGVVNNIVVYYLRGGSTNTVSFDNEYILFKADKTGTYYDGSTSNVVWNFANAGTDSSKIVYTIYYTAGALNVTWENVVYKNGLIRYDEYYTRSGANAHSQGLRMPQ